jgi:hypothetical protein
MSRTSGGLTAGSGIVARLRQNVCMRGIHSQYASPSKVHFAILI